MQEFLSAYKSTLTLNSSLSVLPNCNPWQDLTPFYFVRSNYLYWTANIEQSYCLSLTSPPGACTPCSSGCSYQDLENPSCHRACNSTSCGNDNLECMGGEGCYWFMLGDGNCNSNCPGDPDCTADQGVCAPGCLYADMQAGHCPSACAGFCLLFCSSDFCSPDCSYSEMSSGLCPAECTMGCFPNCSMEFCSPGCRYAELLAGTCDNCTSTCLANCTGSCSTGSYYSDMAQGNCPASCGEAECFQHCSADYCSAGCSYSDLAIGNCSGACTSRYLEKCNSTDVCSPGCLYSDMAAGRCSVQCTGNCFENCDSLYCSPGCLRSDVTESNCPKDCDKNLCCNVSSPTKWRNGIQLVIIIVPLLTGFFL